MATCEIQSPTSKILKIGSKPIGKNPSLTVRRVLIFKGQPRNFLLKVLQNIPKAEAINRIKASSLLKRGQ